MNKAVPWNVNGVGFDARETARDAARRQGKSLGEWLHGVIADHASDLGVEESNMVGHQKIDAVTSRLERLSARSQEHDRHVRAPQQGAAGDRVSGETALRPQRIGEEEEANVSRPIRRRRDKASFESAELILEEAIEAMERRAQRAERRTDKAIQSVADLLQRNESQRDRERDSVSTLARQLSDIETRLCDRLAQTDDNPVKSALARLEARLDTIGRRSAAEALARQQTRRPADAEPGKADAPAPLHRLEEKLDTILDAVHGRPSQRTPQVSPIALATAQSATDRDRIGGAIADITKRQQSLDGGKSAVSLRDAILRRGGSVPAQHRAPEPAAAAAPYTAMQAEIAKLASTIEDLRRDVVAQRQIPSGPITDFDALRAEIASMSEALRELTARGRPRQADRTQDQMEEIRDLIAANAARPLAVERIEHQIADLGERIERRARFEGVAEVGEAAADLRSLAAQSSGTESLAKIESQLENLAAKIDTAVSQGGRSEDVRDRRPEAGSADFTAIERLVRGLGEKIEAVQAPGAGRESFDALQSQMAALSTQFERSDDGLSKLASLERSMRDLFVHLDQTRASVESSAQRAAREVLRIAVEEGRAHTEKGTATSLATMQALQDEADARTNDTLSAVHETLEKVVDRLSTMEKDIANVRSRPPVGAAGEQPAIDAAMPSGSGAPRPARREPTTMSLGAVDPMLDPMHGRRPSAPSSGAPARSVGPVDLDDEQRRAGFIAAARRAAKAAQSDPSVAELKRPQPRTDNLKVGPAKGGTDTALRENLIAQSRDYVARHKRPVLLSIAALFVIVGTMAIVQRIGLGGETQLADAARPAPVARAYDSSTRPVRKSAELTPSTLPKAIPSNAAPSLATPIPGSDPIQTGSIPSLPSFAAQGSAAPAQAQTLPAGLKKMASAGDGAAEYVLGTQYAEGRLVTRDFKAAANWYQKAADQGVVPAQYRLASLYEKGLGVVQDKAKAKSLYLRAAGAGNPRAMHNLAVMLADGDGHPDYEGAATWFRKAAQHGIHDSQYNLAILLARGLGTQQSFVQSYQWFAIAATQNDVDAGKKRDEVATRLSAADLSVAKALAAAFRPRSADVAVTEVQPPPGGWDGAAARSPVNSPSPKISML